MVSGFRGFIKYFYTANVRYLSLLLSSSCPPSTVAWLNDQTGLETISISAALWSGAVCARAPYTVSVLEAVAAVPKQPHEAARLRAHTNFVQKVQSMIT